MNTIATNVPLMGMLNVVNVPPDFIFLMLENARPVHKLFLDVNNVKIKTHARPAISLSFSFPMIMGNANATLNTSQKIKPVSCVHSATQDV